MTAPVRDSGSIGSGQPLEAFRDDARKLSEGDFATRHGNAFLLLSAIRPRSQKDTFSTHLALEGEEEGNTGALSTWVYSLRSSVHLVTIGRSRDSDVIIPERSVSRRHAVMKRSDDGHYLILDAGSSNGTSVNGRNVLTRGAGPPTPVALGDTLRLGSLEFTFVHAAGLREMAAKLR